MPRMTILTEADLRSVVKLDLDAVACVENAFRALATLPVAMPPILQARHSRASWRGRREDRLCARHRRLRHQDQPRLLRQSEARPAEHQRHDGAVLGEDRTGRGAAARQWLPDRRAHRGRRRGGGQASVARGFFDRGDLRRRRSGAAAARGADAGAADQARRASGRATREKAEAAAARPARAARHTGALRAGAPTAPWPAPTSSSPRRRRASRS